MKKCTKCEIEKPLNEFNKMSASKDGHRPSCKACSKQYRAQNKERIAQRNAQYYVQNKEKIIESSAQYRAQNKERIAQRNAQYYVQNKEKHAEYQAQYRSQNKEKIAEQRAKYRAQNKERIAQRNAQWRAKRKSEEPNCIYQIKNLINNKVYIGETTSGELRWKDHLCRLKGNYHDNKLLQEDFDKFGEEAFEWTILKEFESEDKDILLLQEARSIQQHINEGVELYNLVLTIEQLKMLMENK